MSTKNELWFKEPVTIFKSNGQEIEGLIMCHFRFMKKNETIEDIDIHKEFEDFMGGTSVGTLYTFQILTDGTPLYTEVVDYDDYETSGNFEFVVNPFDEVEVE
jgi:hypothetical protein